MTRLDTSSSPGTAAGTATFTAFDGHRRLGSGPTAAVALLVWQAQAGGAAGPLLVFSDTTGRSVDLDTSGTEADVAARHAPAPAAESAPEAEPATTDEPRGRGRPRLGVVPREVTLLPRHWDWLASQPGGASVVLRKLVEEARRGSQARDALRQARDRAYHFMSAMAGDLPGFEEATRALYADDADRLAGLVEAWPADVRDHALALAAPVTA